MFGRALPLGHRLASLAFSSQGEYLAAGWDSGTFMVFDVESTAPIAKYHHRCLHAGLVLAWAPAEDVLAAGGGANGTVTFHTITAMRTGWERFEATASVGGGVDG